MHEGMKDEGILQVLLLRLEMTNGMFRKWFVTGIRLAVFLRTLYVISI